MEQTETQIRLYRAKDAAAYLAISERKLFGLSKSGTIPAVRMGRSVRYDISDLDDFITAAKINNENE